ncbi:MAG TPA: hypothetical protein VMF31_06645 [Solirubrobacterales bacterium]|nr:hypothetical protein [Solirubrobacterales bacterium]
MIGYLAQILMMPLPWAVRRTLLARLWGYRIDPEARIGFSVVRPASLEMGPKSKIGHLNFIRGMDSVRLSARASIGNLNWIYGIPASQTGGSGSDARLELEEGAQLTHRHLVDCTNLVRLGRFSVVAGYRTQILTHSVNIREGVQQAHEISFGEFSFVGTGCIVLGGSRLPDHSVLGAGSVLRNDFEEPYRIYSGTPAVSISAIPEDAAFFSRSEPYVGFGRSADPAG